MRLQSFTRWPVITIVAKRSFGRYSSWSFHSIRGQDMINGFNVSDISTLFGCSSQCHHNRVLRVHLRVLCGSYGSCEIFIAYSPDHHIYKIFVGCAEACHVPRRSRAVTVELNKTRIFSFIFLLYFLLYKFFIQNQRIDHRLYQ